MANIYKHQKLCPHKTGECLGEPDKCYFCKTVMTSKGRGKSEYRPKEKKKARL